MAGPVPPKHPFAWVTINWQDYPALILKWEKVPEANGYVHWWADVAYLDHGEIKTASVPVMRVTKAD